MLYVRNVFLLKSFQFILRTVSYTQLKKYFVSYYFKIIVFIQIKNSHKRIKKSSCFTKYPILCLFYKNICLKSCNYNNQVN